MNGTVCILYSHFFLIASSGDDFLPEARWRLCLKANNWSQQIIHNKAFIWGLLSPWIAYKQITACFSVAMEKSLYLFLTWWVGCSGETGCGHRGNSGQVVKRGPGVQAASQEGCFCFLSALLTGSAKHFHVWMLWCCAWHCYQWVL